MTDQHSSAPPAPVAELPAEASGSATGKVNKMPKVAFASFMGTVIEFYDFGIFGTAAALVFAHAFFPALGTYAGTIVSFATLGVAFVARPIGSVLFGHFGDRLGRKKTLISTMMLMGVATVMIGLLPTAANAGIVAPILLIVLRIAQGLAAGGEWAGAALFTSENAPSERRGFWSMFTNLGGAVANILALLTFFVTGIAMTNESFIAWGWRIPFLLSILLVTVGLYTRLKLEESPVFAGEIQRRGRSSLPFKDALNNQWKEILLGAGSLVTCFAFGYIGIAYLINYGTATLGLGQNGVLAAGIFGNVVNGLCMISGAILSDRFGRRPVLLVVNIVGIPWALILFPLLDTGSPLAFWVGIAVSFFIAGHGWGVCGSFLSELFHTRYRFTAAGLAYSLAAILGGGVPPLVAASIIGSYGGFTFGIFLACYSVAGLVCTLVLRETRATSLDDLASRIGANS
ncbi:sugar phosphate permease [Rhodococcus rhodochrous J45]|uniref:Sugar phosphate permease n=1 Tax=Rhodococcus rhodochrous J45 TaxID=935266 RepID=A0A562DH75_RHORH|nr:MFS transporter [Rhodococcus rhodochrous]TWH08971.1 sugar phosphate permease [Rhodococcus rhodochrous J45]